MSDENNELLDDEESAETIGGTGDEVTGDATESAGDDGYEATVENIAEGDTEESAEDTAEDPESDVDEAKVDATAKAEPEPNGTGFGTSSKRMQAGEYVATEKCRGMALQNPATGARFRRGAPVQVVKVDSWTRSQVDAGLLVRAGKK